MTRLVLMLLLLFPAAAQADTYVGSLGSDTNACTTVAPCKNILRAAQMAGASGTVQVLPGLHSAQVFNGFQPTAPVTVVVQPDAVVPSLELRGTRDIVLDGSLKRGRVGSWNIQRGASWTQRITIRQMDVGGIQFLNNVTDLLITHSQFQSGCSVGVGAPGRTTTADRSYRVTIQFTQFEGCKDAVAIGDVEDLSILSNWCIDAKPPASDPNYHTDCFQVTGGVTNLRAEENTCQNAEDQCMIFQGWTPAVPRPTTILAILRNKLTKGTQGPTNALMLNGVTGGLVSQNIACGRTNGIAIESMQGHPSTGVTFRDNLVSQFRAAPGQVYDYDASNRTVAC